MKKYFILAITLCITSSLKAENKFPTSFTSEDYGFKRIIKKAKQSNKWSDALLSEKMEIIRNVAYEETIGSKIVSDRFTVTCYGGTVDLVIFFDIASDICSKKHELNKRLYKIWTDEGGEFHKDGFDYAHLPEAYPCDLPSSALGALWAQELIENEGNSGYDIEKSFQTFLKPMMPVPDSISKKFSYR